MKRILNTLGVVLALGLGFTSCQEKVRELEFTDKGPNMTVDSYTESVYMGGNIKFDVTLSDEKFDLSTLKAYLLFDGTVVNEFYLRTKEYGKYEGNTILCPLKANIPDGVAQLALVAQNVGMGITADTLDIAVTRPNFDELTLVSNDVEYTLAKTADYEYAMRWDLPADFPAFIKTPAVNEAGDVITLGWDGSAIAPAVDEPIPFSQNNAGNYEVKVNLMTLEASPFGTLTVPLTEAENVMVVDLIQGASLVFPGIPEIYTWDFNFDFFKLEEDNTVTFKAINAKYRLAADFGKKYIRVDVWNPDTDDYAKMNLENPAASAIYAIGEISMPIGGYGWNTTDGAWCLAQHEPNVYQITLVAGNNVSDDNMNWKIFNERGWGNNFGYANKEAGTYAVIGDDGNVHSGSEKLEAGQGYTFKFDFTEGESAVKFTVEEADVPVSGLNIKVNGVAAQKVSATLYRVPVIDLNTGDTITPEGLQIDGSWYLDPDYLTEYGKFAATSGKYGIDIYLDGKYVKFYKVKADGSYATLNEGALWMMGWGIAFPVMTNELAWDPFTKTYCMPEVAPKVFQFTGIAVENGDAEIMGGRFRYDYISCKYFHQNGWGGEMTNANIEFKGNAADLLALPGNIELAEGKTLELGATYRMTIDLSTEGKEIITFDKL